MRNYHAITLTVADENHEYVIMK